MMYVHRNNAIYKRINVTKIANNIRNDVRQVSNKIRFTQVLFCS